MGEQNVSLIQDEQKMKRFVGNLLSDIRALEQMLEKDWFESDVIRIGAEQEMCIVHNQTLKPAPINMEVLEKNPSLNWLDTELAKFNFEINVTPQVFQGNCLSAVEKEITDSIAEINKHLLPWDASIILTGILPTIRKFDVNMYNLTPKPRYRALMEAINAQMVNKDYELRLEGIDELLIKHDSPLLEACNTSFQVHLQVSPRDFVKMYNIAQTLAGPIIAIAANSPLVFGKRLWHESRIALFQQALDTRSSNEHMREKSPRVHFGKRWVNESILDIYREDIARFRVLLAGDEEEDSLRLIGEGKVPRLKALQTHNSTVYRWNRPCYGISDTGKPHLRIENRVLPAGPTTLDEMANAALWLGAMVEMGNQYDDIRRVIMYDDVVDNFEKAARTGIDSKFNWFKDTKVNARELILEELVPMARSGLNRMHVAPEDISRYLDVIEQRAEKHMTGARWQLRSFTRLRETLTQDESVTVLTSAILKNQASGKPVHEWLEPKRKDLESYRPGELKVSEFMETDLFTVHKDDIIELVAEMMDWKKIRYMPVETKEGQLDGLVTSRLLLRHYMKEKKNNISGGLQVKDIMIQDPITISPDATIIEALHLLRDHKIGCLPVVNGRELVGIITEMDFVRISASLIERVGKD